MNHKKTGNNIYIFIILLLLLTLATVLTWFGGISNQKKLISKWEKTKQIPGQLSITYPQNGALFPPEIVSPRITWQDANQTIKNWFITVNSGNSQKLYNGFTEQTFWQPDSALWEEMKRAGLQSNITVTILGYIKSQILSGASVTFRTSPDSVNAAIFYRAVPLPFSYALKNLEKIRWHLGDISSPRTAPALLQNLSLCGNCHSFSQDGKTLAMDVDYANDKGSYVISEISKETVLTSDKIITWSDYKRQDGQNTYGLLSQISPDGRYVASTVKDRSIFVAIDNIDYSQLFFPIKGIIAIYDRQTGKYQALPGADNPELVQSNPSWSPDGKYIYFARTKAFIHPEAEKSRDVVLPTSMARDFIDGKQEFKYDIYRIPFNNGKGGVAEPIPGASNNGMSNFFPRVSPDGKWLVFTKANNFMLLQPDSRLYIIPVAGGEPRQLVSNTMAMNSWHSWSPNSKWLVFSTKFRGPYTELLLTHIDEQGNDSPPVLLENLSFTDRAVNIPEFVTQRTSEWTAIVDQFSSQSFYYLTMGRNKMGEKKYDEAIKLFNQVIAQDPDNAEVYVFKGHTEFLQNNWQEAIKTYGKAIALKSTDQQVYINKGAAHYKLQEYAKAINTFNDALSLNPENSYALYSRGSSKAKTSDYRGAIRDFNRAIQLDSNAVEAFYERGLSKAMLKDLEGAIEDFLQVTKINPQKFQAFARIGECCYQLKKYQSATEAYDRAIQINPDDKELYLYRAACKSALKDYNGAIFDYEQAIARDAGYALAYFRKGLVEIQTGQKEQGCADLFEAKKLGYKEGDREIKKYCGK